MLADITKKNLILTDIQYGTPYLNQRASANRLLALKYAQWRISTEKAWTVIFASDLIEYAFLGVSLSDAKFMGGEY